MDNEKLIEIVRDYNYLYDSSTKYYSDGHKKDQAWKEIGIKLKRNGKECKKAWALLRDAFRRSIKKRKYPKNGQVSEKKWKYEEEMSFLLPHMKERPTTAFDPFDNDNDIDDSASEEKYFAQSPEVEFQATDTVVYTPEATQYCPQPKRSRQSQDETGETPNLVLIKYLMDCKKNTDDIEQFMAGITTTVRSFPPRDRAIAKAKIFEIVSHMELDILSRPSTSNSVSTPLIEPIKIEPPM